jgi:hypothetical protein
MKDLGEAKFLLGIKIEREGGYLSLSQEEYLSRVLNRFGMSNCKSTNTPLELGIKNSLSNRNPEEDKTTDKFPYREAIGCLMYAMLCTRPDLGFPICYLSQFSNAPGDEHWMAIKRVLRYVKGTQSLRLVYEKGELDLLGYSDADWAGDTNKRKSTSGFVFLLGGGAVSWGSKKQACVALSTTEAEYVALSQATREAIWLQELLNEFLQVPQKVVTMMVDNQSCIALARNPVHHKRTKHIDIQYHFIREALENERITLNYCPTEEMAADFLTKELGTQKHQRCCFNVGLK